MKLHYVGKNIDITDSLREVADKKYGRLSKYFQNDLDGKVTFSAEKDRRIAEVTIRLPGTILRSEQSSDDLYTSIDRTVDALESQIRKYKTKLQKRHSHDQSIRFDNIETYETETVEKADEDKRIVKTKRFDLKPMMPEEAAMQMELLGHNFFVYRDGESDEVHVIYKRNDGNYGLIEAE